MFRLVGCYMSLSPRHVTAIALDSFARAPSAMVVKHTSANVLSRVWTMEVEGFPVGSLYKLAINEELRVHRSVHVAAL